ncbi:hypothetical protein P4O66_014333 [Electrophorus voltai]|uniref:Beta-2-microglobulin n=1 Tax=Electrophorus voltai TaxID=2609070 RepID=A0AAD8Z007_9TELE|nr:hypothetical protein P4O66_014333 [Electrophorus voltai]
MKPFLFFAVVCAFYISVQAKSSPPKVQVYSYSPGEFDKENVLICHVSDFHPADIEIDLLKNGIVIPNANQTDLSFSQGWKFYLTKSVPFKPKKSDDYCCKVKHMSEVKKYMWEPDM